jgi:tripartite-type tricarboxylate transporter receptor subunit TctC
MRGLDRRTVVAGLGATLSAGLTIRPGDAIAQAWPGREITVINPFPPGSATDLLTRIYARVLQTKLNAAAVVKNIPGSAAAIGSAQIAASKPDGYTLGMVGTGAILAPHILDVPYKWQSDFDFIGQIADLYWGVIVAANSPVKSIDDLIALSKQRRVTYGANSPNGSAAMFQLTQLTGGNFKWVVFQGAVETVTQAIGGHVDAAVSTATDAVAQIQAGNLRLLASASSQRWPAFPDVRTLKELGYEAESLSSVGFAFPKGVDQAIRSRAEQALKEGIEDPAVQKEIAALGVIRIFRDGGAYREHLSASEGVLVPILKEAGMLRT